MLETMVAAITLAFAFGIVGTALSVQRDTERRPPGEAPVERAIPYASGFDAGGLGAPRPGTEEGGSR